MSAAPLLAALLLLGAGAARGAAQDAPVVPLPEEARRALEPLGPGVVGEALPARPIRDPARLRHLTRGTWTYRIVEGADRGQEQTVRVEPVDDGDPNAWRVAVGDEVQQLEVTSDHRVVKRAQDDRGSDRLVVYRPGLVLEPDMQVGQSRTVETGIATYKGGDSGRPEYDGHLEYTIRYLGAYRVVTPAGPFDARLLEHRYVMEIGPAKARYHSFGFYADDVGNVAEVSDESVSALWVYRRSSRSGRLLLSAPGE